LKGFLGPGVEQQLPESASMVDRGKDGASRTSDFSFSLTSFIQYLSVWLFMFSTQKSGMRQMLPFFGNSKDWTVELTLGWLDKAKF
jgi:hypothetical protein